MYWVLEREDSEVIGNVSVVKEWSNWNAGYYWWIQSMFLHVSRINFFIYWTHPREITSILAIVLFFISYAAYQNASKQIGAIDVDTYKAHIDSDIQLIHYREVI